MDSAKLKVFCTLCGTQSNFIDTVCRVGFALQVVWIDLYQCPKCGSWTYKKGTNPKMKKEVT